MIEELDLETYLSLTKKSFSIYVFDKIKLKNVYEEEYKIEENYNSLNNVHLTKFLDRNIFKIEKLIGRFIKNIIVVIENDQIFKINIGIKKKNYQDSINDKYLENILVESKDLIKENYPNNKIIHMIIEKYIINNESYSKFMKNLNSDHLCTELNFIIISNQLVLELDRILDKYQIEIVRYLDLNYILKLFEEDNFEFSTMLHKVKNGYNSNEVILVPKTLKKYGIFEKFFQLFS